MEAAECRKHLRPIPRDLAEKAVLHSKEPGSAGRTKVAVASSL